MDYKKLGFKAGLEIHAQLAGKKLFCNCPCEIKDGKPDFRVKRYLRASESELGEVDKAALHELKKGKYFIYEGYNDVNCLIELDEEPPRELNQEALKATLVVAKLLNANIQPVVQFMRKVIIDGSNVSAFQRTALVATSGYINTSKGKVGIDSICLEEEAAKKVKDTKEFRVYNISRLCIPLIEIATDASIQDPKHAKEVAEKLGMILRSIKQTKRGLGTIRQDVNVSIKGGARVEVKGFQDFKNIPKVIDNEVKRQADLINKKKKVESEVRNAKPDFTTEYLRPMPGAARMYLETDIELVTIDNKLLKEIELPELIDNKIEKLEEKYNISPDQARELVKKDLVDFFMMAKGTKKLKDNFVAEIILALPKEIKRAHNIEVKTDKFLLSLIEYIDEGKISKNLLEKIYLDKSEGKEFNIKNYQLESKDLEKEIKDIINKNKGAPFNALMGEVMKHFKGKVDGKKASEIIKKLM